MEEQGSKQVKVVGLDNKRQITVTLACTADGQPASHLRRENNSMSSEIQISGGMVSYSVGESLGKLRNNHESGYNRDSPLSKNTRKANKYKATQKALLIRDVFKGHQSEDVLVRLKRNNVELVYIPPNCTDKLQPIDQLINKEYKEALKREFHTWCSDKILDKFSDDKENDVTSIDLKLSTLKPIHASWLVRAQGKITQNKDLIIKSFETTGILGVI